MAIKGEWAFVPVILLYFACSSGAPRQQRQQFFCGFFWRFCYWPNAGPWSERIGIWRPECGVWLCHVSTRLVFWKLVVSTRKAGSYPTSPPPSEPKRKALRPCTPRGARFLYFVKAPPVENFAWLPVGIINSAKFKCSSVSLMQARPHMKLFFGASTLVRKWLAKMTKMAVLAKITKMTPMA